MLDLFDSILEKGVHKERETQWALPCDHPSNEMVSAHVRSSLSNV